MTTDNSEFAAALAVLNNAWHGYANAKEVVERALRLADKVTREPSETMLCSAMHAPESYKEEFQAMILAAQDEIAQQKDTADAE